MLIKELIKEYIVKEGKETTKVTLSELANKLKEIDGSSASAFWMLCETDARLKKTGNPYRDEKVTKLSRYNGLLNFNYTNSVNNQLEREGKEANFEAQENWHAKKFDKVNGCIAEKAEGNSSQEYIWFKNDNSDRIAFAINGNVANESDTAICEQFIPPHSPNKSQGTEVAITPLTIKLQNIRLLKAKGGFYEVV